MNLGDSITLDNMLGGGLEEMFQTEIKRVINNIEDPNTSAKAKRKISIEIEISPTGERKAANFTVDVRSKLAGREKQAGIMFFEDEKAINIDTNQTEIDFPNVKELNSKQ